MKRTFASSIFIIILLVSLQLTFVRNAQSFHFVLPSTLWANSFQSWSLQGWTMKKGGSNAVVEFSTLETYSSPYSLHVNSSSQNSGFAFAIGPSDWMSPPLSNGSLCSIDYSKKYVIEFYFCIPGTNNNLLNVFRNQHIITGIQGATLYWEMGGSRYNITTLEENRWYRITYWVVPGTGFYIDVYDTVNKKYVVEDQFCRFHGGTFNRPPFVVGDIEDGVEQYGEAYWDDFKIYFHSKPRVNIDFRLLAIEGYFGNVSMKSAEHLIMNLTKFFNWQNRTSNYIGVNFYSHIHLFSAVPYNSLYEDAKRFYNGGISDKSRILNEIRSFLGATSPGCSNTFTIRIFYYCGHSGLNSSSSYKFPYILLGKDVNPDPKISSEELKRAFNHGDLSSSNCTLLIFDSCYSERYIGAFDSHHNYQENLLRKGRVILSACKYNQKAYGTSETWGNSPGNWTYFTGHTDLYTNYKHIGPIGIIGAINQKSRFDFNKDGWLHIGEIFDFARKTTKNFVKYWSTKKQEPTMGSGVRAAKIPFVMYNPKANFAWNGPPGDSPSRQNYDSWSQHGNYAFQTGFSNVIGPVNNTPLYYRQITSVNDTSYGAPLYTIQCSSVRITDNMVFFSANSTFYGLDLITGEKIWEFTANNSISTSAAIYNGTVFFGVGSPGKLYALDEVTGMLRWTYDLPTSATVTSPPTVADDKIFFGTSDGYFYVLNQTTGTQIWNFSAGGKIQSSPAVAYNRVFFGSYDGAIYALEEDTGTLIWEYQTFSPVISSPAIHNGMLFIGTYDLPRVLALNATGNTPDLIWEYQTVAPVTSSPSVDTVKGLVVVADENGNIYCFKEMSPNPPLWTELIDPINMSSPAISNNSLIYIGSLDGKIYCLNETTGQVVWSYLIGNSVVASPALTDDHVIISSTDGAVYCFGIPFPVYDVTAVSLTVSGLNAPWDQPLHLTYTVANNGNRLETFNVTLYYFTHEIWTPPSYLQPTLIYSTTVTLLPGENITLTYDWYPPRLHRTFSILLETQELEYELYPLDNIFVLRYLRLLSVPNGGAGRNALFL